MISVRNSELASEKTTPKKGKLCHWLNLVLDINTEIQELEQDKIHKCREGEKSEDKRHQGVTGCLKKEYTRKLRMN